MTNPNKENSVRGYVWNKIYKKTTIKNIRFKTDIYMCEDSIFSYDVLSTINTIGLVKLPLYYYRIYKNSSTRNSNVERTCTALYAYEILIERASSLDKEIMENYIKEYLGWNIIVCDTLIMPKDKQIYQNIKENLKKYNKLDYLQGKGMSFKIKVILARHSFKIYQMLKHILKRYSCLKK